MNFRDWLRTRNTEGYKSMACYSISGWCQAQAISPFKRSNETGLRALCCRSVRRDELGGTEVKQTEPAWTLSLQSCQYPWKYLWGPAHYLSVKASWRQSITGIVLLLIGELTRDAEPLSRDHTANVKQMEDCYLCQANSSWPPGCRLPTLRYWS